MASGDSLWLNTKANKGEAVLNFPWVFGFRRCQGSEAVPSFVKHFFISSLYIYIYTYKNLGDILLRQTFKHTSAKSALSSVLL